MSENTQALPIWRVTSASKRGSAHADAVPNQDALQFTTVPDGDGDAWVAAVSDGHGGKRYVRSDTGSSLAVATAVCQLAEVVRGDVGEVPLDDLLRGQVPEIVAQWRQAALAHLAANPFTAEEAARAGQSLEAEPIVAYGATLLIVVVCAAGVGVAQIGDGDALVRTHGFAMRPVPDDPRLVAGETTSLCLDSAVADFRYAALPASAEPDLVMLSSDGYSNSFADSDWWRAVVRDLVSFLDNHGFDALTDQFPDWLAESAEVGGDDVSAVVLARSPLLVPPELGDGAVVASSAGQPTTVPAEAPDHEDVGDETGDTRSRRRLIYALSIVPIAALIVLTLLLVHGHGGGNTPSVPAGPTATPSTTPSASGSPPASPSAATGGQGGHHQHKHVSTLSPASVATRKAGSGHG